MRSLVLRISQFIVLVGMLLSAPSISLALASDTIASRLVLAGIKVEFSQESSDEIYFIVADLNAPKNKVYTVPGYRPYFRSYHVPTVAASAGLHSHFYWSAKHIGTLKDVTLWQRSLSKNTGTQVLLSLVEADLPPWNMDDLLGTIKLTVVNDNGRLKSKLSLDKYSKLIVMGGKPSKDGSFYVRVKNGSASYLMHLRLDALAKAPEKSLGTR